MFMFVDSKIKEKVSFVVWTLNLFFNIVSDKIVLVYKSWLIILKMLECMQFKILYSYNFKSYKILTSSYSKTMRK